MRITFHIRWRDVVAIRLLHAFCVGMAVLSSVSCLKYDMDNGSATRQRISSSVKSIRQSRSYTPTDADITVYVTATSGASGSESLVFQNKVFGWNGYRLMGDTDWPAQGGNYHFYGSNAPTEYRISGTSVWADGGQDVICAYVASPVWGGVNTLAFKHIFGRIGSATLSVESGWTLSDVSVTINAVIGGTYDIRTGYGHTDVTGWKELVYMSGFSVVPANVGTVDINAFLVPGEYQVTASWRATSGGTTQEFFDMSTTITVVAGESQDISVTLGGKLTISTAIASWDPGTINVSETS